ncbi:MAG TPA: gluconokinase, partial [Trinickia sp.]|nr:gluconokinase [Trinickia sp.]
MVATISFVLRISAFAEAMHFGEIRAHRSKSDEHASLKMGLSGEAMILIVMGVSGAGKTRVGELLAERLSCSFIDGDAFHSDANKEKMAHGIPMTDDDRWPWLATIRE